VLGPFGGSGTTALACQFLGIQPIIAEVNPFLADLIEAKLTTYKPDDLVRDLARVAKAAENSRVRARRVFGYPSTSR
jgi:DNA modification methylase